MKKYFLLVLTFLFILAITACSDNPADSGDRNVPPESTAPKQTDSNQSHPGKTLIVYFSATGNTKQIAEYIASATGGDMFELVPEIPYSSEDLNWNDDDSRVSYEHNNPEARNIALTSSTVDNFDDYDTIFIGYPIWWGIAAWPVDSFLASNDFTGKTIVPFCTSASSPIGNSVELLEETAGTGNWLDGARFSSSTTEIEIYDWISSLESY